MGGKELYGRTNRGEGRDGGLRGDFGLVLSDSKRNGLACSSTSARVRLGLPSTPMNYSRRILQIDHPCFQQENTNNGNNIQQAYRFHSLASANTPGSHPYPVANNRSGPYMRTFRLVISSGRNLFWKARY